MSFFLQWYRQIADSFEWDKAPLQDFRWPLGAAVAYLAVISLMVLRNSFAAKAGAGGSKKVSQSMDWLRLISGWHYMIISLGSAVMFVGCALELYNRIVLGAELADSHQFQSKPRSYGSARFGWLVCEYTSHGEAPLDPFTGVLRSGDRTELRAAGPLYFWSYVYYLSKFYELLDTIVSLARGSSGLFKLIGGRECRSRSSPPHFAVHVFHHVFVLFMAYSWVEERQSTQWIGLLFNTAVHVIMYYYYYERARLRLPAWKNWVTYSQIIQFGVSLLIVLPLFVHAQYGDQLPWIVDSGPSPSMLDGLLHWLGYDRIEGVHGDCAGAPALWRNVAFNAILLFGFVGVLRSNTNRSKRKKE